MKKRGEDKSAMMHPPVFVVNSLETMVVVFSSRRIIDGQVCGLESALTCLITD